LHPRKGRSFSFPLLLQQSKSRVKGLSQGHQFLRRFSKNSLYQKPLFKRRRVRALKILWRKNQKPLFRGRRVKVVLSLLKGNNKPLYIRVRIKVLKCLWRVKMKPLRKALRSLLKEKMKPLC
jgi:hypothetical protein